MPTTNTALVETATTNNMAVAETPVMGKFDYDKQIAIMSPEDKQRYVALSKGINPADITSIQTYGSELSSVISSNGDLLLQSVRADNTNEVIEMTNDLLKQLNLIDIDEVGGGSKWKAFMRRTPVLKRFVKGVENLFSEYETVISNVEGITKKINAAKMVALRDNGSLQQIFDNDVNYINQIRELILGAKIKKQELLTEVDRMSADPMVETYQIADVQNFINSLDQRIADMETQEYILTQNLLQIRATQHNNLAIAQKSDNIVTNIIPVWKDQISLAIIMDNQKNSVEAEKAISEFTNEMLRKNAEKLKINSINVARESERQVIDLETINKLNKELTETLTEVRRIHDEGIQNRKAIETSLQGFAEQLNKNVLGAA